MNVELPEWLPDIVSFSDFDSDFNKYLEHLHTIFKSDFIESMPTYKGKPVYFDRRIINSYPACFWHLITEDKINNYERVDFENVCLLRCERIGWIRPIIENHTDSVVSCWQNKRGKKQNTIFFLEDHDYVVILNNKNRFYLVSAYYINYPHRKEQFIRERDRFLEMQKPPLFGTA